MIRSPVPNFSAIIHYQLHCNQLTSAELIAPNFALRYLIEVPYTANVYSPTNLEGSRRNEEPLVYLLWYRPGLEIISLGDFGLICVSSMRRAGVADIGT
jgi:hypothetical protein